MAGGQSRSLPLILFGMLRMAPAQRGVKLGPGRLDAELRALVMPMAFPHAELRPYGVLRYSVFSRYAGSLRGAASVVRDGRLPPPATRRPPPAARRPPPAAREAPWHRTALSYHSQA